MQSVPPSRAQRVTTYGAREEICMPTQRQTLTPTPPYDFALALDYVRASPSAVLDRVSAEGVYSRAQRLHGQPALLRLWSEGTRAAPRLGLSVTADASPGTLEAMRTEAARLLTRMFALDVDPAPFLALREGDPVFGALLDRFPGLRPVMHAEPFESLLWAIVGQQVNVSFARKLKLALVDLCGERYTCEGAAYPLRPTAEALAALDPEALRERQFSRQKVRYLLGTARAVDMGTLDLAAVETLPAEEALTALTRLDGVGRWTAEYVLMRGFGARDSIPAADLGLRAVLGRAYGLGRHASEAEVRAYAEAWAGWRGWAAFFWWHTLQQKVTWEGGTPVALPSATGAHINH